MNRATLIGNLARDIELRTIPSGKSVATGAIATNKTWTDDKGQKQQKVSFHNFVVWGKLAEVFAKYLKKGSKVMIEGELQTRDWTGQDGVKRYATEVIVNNFEFLTPAAKTPEQKPKEPEQATQEAPIDFPEEEIENAIDVSNFPF